MKKWLIFFMVLSCSVLSFSTCGLIGDKTASMSLIYGAVALFSFVLLAAYCVFAYKKEVWFVFLFLSVSVINAGYFFLSVSKTLDAALWANRISYLGSVFLPLIMLVIIMKECKIHYKKRFIGMLFTVSILIFLLAASPGILDVYYKSVSLATINGISVLEKVYGPLHSVYLFYLVFYFGFMVAVIIYSSIEKKIKKATHAIIIAGSVLINICIWLFEQLVKMDFELLSVSYIITELFLLGIHILLNEKGTEEEKVYIKEAEKTFFDTAESEISDMEALLFFNECLSSLTPSERKILDLHFSGKSTKEIMEELCITENTVKFHNKNLYRKFGVSSKKQLLAICKENGFSVL